MVVWIHSVQVLIDVIHTLQCISFIFRIGINYIVKDKLIIYIVQVLLTLQSPYQLKSQSPYTVFDIIYIYVSIYRQFICTEGYTTITDKRVTGTLF